MSTGYEADDIMATLAKWASRQSLTTVLVSDDKDLLSAATDDVSELLTEIDYGHASLALLTKRRYVYLSFDAHIPFIRSTSIKKEHSYCMDQR